jgi:hypothetical protein
MAAPCASKQKADARETLQFEAQEKALQMMKRSMMIGTLVAAGSVYLGWVLGKRVRPSLCLPPLARPDAQICLAF